jgi:hypothetical protein
MAALKFFLKYFCEGQATKKNLKQSALDFDGDNKKDVEQEGNKTFLQRYRKIIGMSIPVIIVHSVWWTYMATTDRFGLFEGRAGLNGIPRWYMSITMIFGSMLAGATSEGKREKD